MACGWCRGVDDVGTVAVTSATQAVPAGATVAIKMAGSLPVYLYDAAFKERLQIQMEMQGFTVDTLAIDSNAGLITRDWTGTAQARFAARSSVDGIVSAVRTAAENAGSYSPTATIPAYGQVDQLELPGGTLDHVLGSTASGLGAALEGLGQIPKAVANLPVILVIGIVALVALVAFGPNVKHIARAVPRV